MKIELFWYETRFFLTRLHVQMIAAAPKGFAPAADLEQTIQKKPCPPCLGEALIGGSIKYIMIFMIRE